MAAVSIGGSIRIENQDRTHSGSFTPNVNSLDYNLEKYFNFPANGKPNGTDVYVADLKQLVTPLLDSSGCIVQTPVVSS
jgi:hypothetical protein